MFERIWQRVQRRLTLSAVRRAAKRATLGELDFLGVWEEVQRVLVCWPGDAMDVLAARVVFNRIRERFPDASLAVLELPGVGASLPSEVEAEIIQVRKEDLSAFGIPSKRLRFRLAEAGFDAVVDLSPKFDPLAGFLCLASNAKVRIGFAGADGDLVYNYQVAPRGDRSGIDRYRVMARYIG